MASEIAFFAGPEEQRRWLYDTLGDTTWCVAEHTRDQRVTGVDRSQVDELTFERDPLSLQLFLGRRDLCDAPVWRETADGRPTVDFVRSRAVQYVPATIAQDVMIEGRLAIMRDRYYADLGLEFLPFKSWFTSLVTSLERAIHTPGVRVLSRLESEPWAVTPRKILVSPMAIEWRKAGHKLKQAAESRVEFDFVVVTS
jgi:hypothetical protein